METVLCLDGFFLNHLMRNHHNIQYFSENKILNQMSQVLCKKIFDNKILQNGLDNT